MEIPLPTELAEKEQKWFGAWPVAFYLAVLLFFLFPQVFLGLETFVFRDYFLFSYPLAFHAREAFWQGEIPLWNPLNHCGAPFAAQWATMVYYPGSLLYYLLPLNWSLGLFTLLHLWWGGMGMYWLARYWGLRPVAGCFAGAVFVANGITLSSLCWPHYIAAVGWMPWVLTAVQQGWREGGRRLVLAGLAGALQMLTGAPELLLLTWLTLGSLWLAELPRVGFGWALTGKRFLAIIVMVAGLCAIQLLPFMELLRHSQRDRFYADDSWSMASTGWANFLVPLFGLVHDLQGVLFQRDQYLIPTYYLGAGAALLAILGLFKRGTSHRGVMAVLLILGLTLSLGNEGLVYPWIKKVVPQIGVLRYPIKMVFLLLVPVCYLAAAGWQSAYALPADKARRQYWCGVAGALLLLMAGIALYAWLFPFGDLPKEDWRPTAVSAAKSGTWLVLATVLLLSLDRLRPRGLLWASALILLVIHWMDIYTHVPVIHPTVALSAYDPGFLRLQPAPVFGQGRAKISQKAYAEVFRRVIQDPYTNLLCNRLALSGNLNLLEGYASVPGFYPLTILEANDIHRDFFSTDSRPQPHLEDFLGVIQTSRKDSSLEWVSRSNAMPLMTGGQTPWLVAETNTRRSLFTPGLDLRRQVVLPENLRPVVRAQPGGQVKISQVHYGRQLVTARVEASATSLVVVAQTYYPAWRAYVDGKPVPLWRANHAYQAVEVPDGLHEVKLVYEDPLWRLGAILSAGTLLVCGLGWLSLPCRQRSLGQEIV